MSVLEPIGLPYLLHLLMDCLPEKLHDNSVAHLFVHLSNTLVYPATSLRDCLPERNKDVMRYSASLHLLRCSTRLSLGQ